ncbi:hypothetical protein [Flammeovirga sp. SJP92]|uniref:hypothetical protein n=1 Tax=Flammeovirga sp. SJP92 TaxID=1775430 RepID=UPI000788C483|nr:hypothetical protein [Flammeovirga sp. SJP92]KXX72710.1 hypothetical protein AVL50_32300 [Flammeovirga sp. SJP92]
MQVKTNIQQDAVNQVYEYTANLMVTEKKSAAEAKAILMAKGLKEEVTTIIVDNIQQQINEAKAKQGNKDMLYGALWCIGGLVLTLIIVFGSIQFLKGAF